MMNKDVNILGTWSVTSINSTTRSRLSDVFVVNTYLNARMTFSGDNKYGTVIINNRNKMTKKALWSMVNYYCHNTGKDIQKISISIDGKITADVFKITSEKENRIILEGNNIKIKAKQI